MLRSWTSRTEPGPSFAEDGAGDAHSDYDDGIPAQLHQEYVPSAERRASSEAQYHGNAAIDIVLVHGLGSKYKTTWAYKRPDGSRYHWMKEKLPKDMPDARILGFEYPSRWYNDPVATDLTECASELLRSLIRDRCHIDSQEMCRTRRTRPILFVGHSFGGLVIKQAMVMAGHVLPSNSSERWEYETHRDLLSAVAGVIFLGTPHRGSQFALAAGWKMSLGSQVLRVSSNEEIITILKPGSYVLNELQRNFAQLCPDQRMAGLKLVCYYEMREISLLRKKVVSQSSASLDAAASRGMDANHMDMNTFYEGDEGRRDNNYDHFISDVRMVFHESARTVPRRFEGWVYGSVTPDPERERLQTWLDPSLKAWNTTYTLKLEVQQKAPYTCRWIDTNKAFDAWSRGDVGVNTLWISGIAGSGKSVLAAYVIKSLRDESKAANGHSESCANSAVQPCGWKDGTVPVLMFFCGVDRKSESTERILATLIHQLLLTRPDSQELFDVAQRLKTEALKGEAPQATVMMKYFQEMADITGPMFIVIDNLEQIPEPTLLLDKLSVFAGSKHVHLYISSQSTEEIAVSLRNGFGVEQPLLITDHSADDIKRFTESHSAALLAQKPQLLEMKETILGSLQGRAMGMFQWVNSALQQLSSVEDPRYVEAKLNSISSDLLSTYDKSFERFSLNRDETEERRIQMCLKFIAASATPVTALDVKMAYLIREMMYQRDHDADPAAASIRMEMQIRELFEKEDSREVAEREIKQYIGTVVVTCSDGTLAFSHDTILRALTKADAPKDDGAGKFKFSRDDAHRELALLCMTVCQVTTFAHANSFQNWHVPLVQYAWHYWAYHFKHSKMAFTTAEDGSQIRTLLQAYPSIKGDWEKQDAFQGTFNKMVDGVTRDAVLYLEALIDFISRPLRAVPGRFTDREYVLSLQRAQDSLVQPTKDLCALRRSLPDPVSSRLQHLAKGVRKAAAQPFATSLGSMQRHTADAMAGATAKLAGPKPTSVTRLSLDAHLEAHPAFPRPGASPKLLLEAARGLRVAALRFAVDPMYSALLATAEGTSFSPLHPLVFVAQLLEEAGRYPYWDALPPGSGHLLEAFLCASEDPEFPSSRFVLHCFAWRDPRLTAEEGTPASPTTRRGSLAGVAAMGGVGIGSGMGGGLGGGMYYGMGAVAALRIDLRPSPGGGPAMGLTRVSTENWEQVKRLHQMKAAHYYAARETYALFRSDKDWVNKYISNPLTNLHMRFSLVVEENAGGDTMNEDPVVALGRYAPTEVHDQPLMSFVRALPHQLKAFFIHYVVLILEVFGRVGRQVLAVHWGKIEMAGVELKAVGHFWRRFLPPGRFGGADELDAQGQPIPRLSALWAVPALLLFAARCRWFPSWGAYMWYHGWFNFAYAWQHPAAYLELQRELSVGFWSFLWLMTRHGFVVVVGQTARTLTQQREFVAHKHIGPVLITYALFDSLCTVDRSLFAVATAVATLASCTQVMLWDVGTVAELFKFSAFFWFSVFVQIAVSMVQMGALEHGGGWVAVLGGSVAQVVLLITCALYYVPITTFFWRLASPLRKGAKWVFVHWMDASVATAKAVGTGIIAVAVWRAFWSMHKFVWDPYDIEGSLKQLLEASELVKKTLHAAPLPTLLPAASNGSAVGQGGSNAQLTKITATALTAAERQRRTEGELKRIGWYPLGERRLGAPPSKGAPSNKAKPGSSASALSLSAPRTVVSESLLLTGPPAALPPLRQVTSDAHRAVSSGLAEAADEVAAYVTNPALDRHGRPSARPSLAAHAAALGRVAEEAALASGEGIAMAVDGVLSFGGDVVERVGLGVAEGSGQVGKVGRGAVRLLVGAGGAGEDAGGAAAGRVSLSVGSGLVRIGEGATVLAGKGLSDAVRDARLVGRDVVVGRLKEE